MKIAVVQGTRPEILKNYSIVHALRECDTPYLVLHTSQHSSPEMCDAMYADTGYQPDQCLRKPYRFGLTVDWLQSVFAEQDITHVIVNGDTAASLAGAIAAMYMDIGVSHIEAGLRSWDTQMLEERNRILVDSIASHLFAYTEYERSVLTNSLDVRGKIFIEGNTTVDLIHDFAHRIQKPPVSSDFIFLTLHRRELTNNRERLRNVLITLSNIAETVCPIIFAAHPRTADAISRYDFKKLLSKKILLLEPQRVFDSLGYQKFAKLVITDSGCVQEEAYILGTPCVTLRENTERHLTIKHGANRISGFDPDRIYFLIRSLIDMEAGNWPEIYGYVGVGERIVKRLLMNLP
jgi:UDP-N-acetylglucosamine 2-epimerase (non-hydrolysing)